MVHTRYDPRLRSYCSDTGGTPSLHGRRYQPHIVYKLGFPNLLRPSPLDMLCTQRRPCPNRSQAHSACTHGYQLLHSFQHDNDRIGCFPRWQRSGQRRSVHRWHLPGPAMVPGKHGEQRAPCTEEEPGAQEKPTTHGHMAIIPRSIHYKIMGLLKTLLNHCSSQHELFELQTACPRLLSMAGSGPKPLPLSQPLQSRRNIFQTHSSPSPQHPHRRRCLHYLETLLLRNKVQQGEFQLEPAA